jgi:hypothetical protein
LNRPRSVSNHVMLDMAMIAPVLVASLERTLLFPWKKWVKISVSKRYFKACPLHRKR